MYDYVISLREGIMDAWGGIIGAMRSSGKSKHATTLKRMRANNAVAAAVLQPYVSSIFQLLNTVANDQNRSESLMRASMGVIG